MAISKLSKEYHVRNYECDNHGNLRILTLMNILQDAADSHATALGVGYEFCLEHGLAWIAAHYHIKIFRAPHIHENIIINTWPSEEQKLSAIRDYLITDKSGEVLVQASTQWVLLDTSSKRPQLLRARLPEYHILNEKADNYTFTKLETVTEASFQKEFEVRFDDIDFNNHVNNAVYPLWASEAIDHTFRTQHTITDLVISFKKETFLGETIKVLSSLSDKNSLHTIICKNDNRELARLAITWKAIK